MKPILIRGHHDAIESAAGLLIEGTYWAGLTLKIVVRGPLGPGRSLESRSTIA
jgi:hypothetical protein